MNGIKDLTRGSIARHLVRLTIPMFLGIASMIGASMIDTVYIGWIGTVELAAVSFTFPLVMATTSVAMGLGIGATSIMSRTLGSGERDDSIEIGTHTLVLVALFVLVVTVLGFVYSPELFRLLGARDDILQLTVDYTRIWFIGLPLFAWPMVGGSMLRALGDARTPGILMTASALLQVVVAPVLIFGVGAWDGLGYLGSAWAFVVSRLAVFVWTLTVFARVGFFRPLGPFAGVLASWREVLRIGVPSIFASLVGPVSMSVLLGLLARHGHEVVAGFGVAVRVESLAMMVLMALSSSVAPFVGQNYGANDFDRIRASMRISYRFALAWGLFAFVVLAGLGETIVGAINDDPAVIATTYAYLVIVSLTMGLMGVSMIAGTAFVALGLPIPTLIMSIARMLVILLPLAYILDALIGYRGIFAATSIANLIVAAWGYVWFKRVLRASNRRSIADVPAAVD